MIGRRHRAFSLLELAVVLALSGMMMGYMFSVIDDVDSSQKSGCAVSTRAQLNYIRAQIEAFARNNDRLPLPSRRDVALGSGYGVEDDGSHITNVAGTSWGSLPFMTLGLGASYANDCWGNKFTYVVTTALTTNNTSGGYLDNTVLGNMALKSSAANTVNSEIAYAIISHGRDELGAVKVSYAVDGTPNWCTGSTDIAYTNCLADSATIMNAPFNDGKDAGANYFDDVVVASGRPVVLTTTDTTNIYCWGDNTYGQLGDNTTTARSTLGLIHSTKHYISVVDGARHNCGLTNVGEVYCWGDNGTGQLGDTSNTQRLEPTKVSGSGTAPLLFTQITAGGYHSCGIVESGDAYCWGDNTYGELGNNSFVSTAAPVLVAGSLKFKQISAGNYITCGVTAANTIYCWGYNQWGQLFGGPPGGNVKVPTIINSALKFRSVTLNHSNVTKCAVSTSGDGYCWGYGGHGERGDGIDGGPDDSITTISGGLKFDQISMGSMHACGLTSAGDAYCWGFNWYGQMGSTSCVTPTYYQSVPCAVEGGHKFVSITSGTEHSCAQKADGSIYCWGRYIANTPTLVTGTGTTPLFMSGVSSGYTTNCAIAPVNKAYCWDGSSNFYGSIGDGTSGSVRANPTEVTDSHIFTKINRFSNFSCGITSAAESYCWGFGLSGQLGTALPYNGFSANPNGLLVAGSHHFKKLWTGSSSTCAIEDNGAGYCWGDGSFGKMGDGTTNTYSTPNYVSNGSHIFLALSPGDEQTCGIKDTGAAYCWGRNVNQSLGVGSLNANEYNPLLPVTGGHIFIDIFSTYRANCGLKDDGTAWCWGNNAVGTLGVGVGDFTNRNAPTAVFGGHIFRQMSVGYRHVCALDDGGYPYCWGYNWSGQIGNGTSGAGTDVSTPYAVLVGGVPTTFKTIKAGNGTSCAYKADGKAYCWGNDGGGVVSTPTLVTGTGTSPLIFDGNISASHCAIAP